MLESLNDTPGRMVLVIAIAALLFAFAAESPIPAQVREGSPPAAGVEELLGFPWARNAEVQEYEDGVPEFSGAAIEPPNVPQIPTAAPEAEAARPAVTPVQKPAQQQSQKPAQKPVPSQPVQQPHAVRQPASTQQQYYCTDGMCYPVSRAPAFRLFRR